MKSIIFGYWGDKKKTNPKAHDKHIQSKNVLNFPIDQEKIY